MEIFRSGYLKMNPRFAIATIVLSDGKETQHLVTKRHALEIGEALIGISITPEEWMAIREQIYTSPLINKNLALEKMANELQGDLDQLKRSVESFIKQQEAQDREGEGWKL